MTINPPRFLVTVLSLWLFTHSHLASAQGEFRVVASIKPVHSILAGLMEGIAPSELLVSGDSTPFDYTLSGEQERGLSTADMVVWVGPELEKFLIEPLSELGPDTYVVTLLDNPNLKILGSRWDDSLRDPYFWLDSRNGLILIDELTEALVSVDPGRSHVYTRNRNKVVKRMAFLDRKLEYGYRGMQQGEAFAYFDTQQYFEQAYALKIGESIAESPASSIETASFLDARNKLVNGRYSCLLVEASMDTRNLGLLTEGVDIPVGHLDSLGAGFESGSDLYFDILEFNTRAIENCFQQAGTRDSAEPEAEVALASEEIGGRFLLVDQNGELVTDKDMQGKYQLVFFGYTSCPDVCPTSMLVASQAFKKLGPLSERVQVYFISVDPERDTPEVMNNYVQYFSQEFIGLTGTTAMIERVADSYKVEYEKVIDENGDRDRYAMDHTASFFLMAPNGRFITKFPFGISAEQLLDKLQKHIRP